ncbi:hypothetical protein [uncultured Sulfitobacter sp.]|uniref:hypothetical protein n=1 Tax=uncultured Sulfitobacter sp. TaxID=191468 RepID=UPI0030D7AAB3|tara:strand:- start:2365 stop:2937 length:573 start_codon:yes stop_codon:yes gene_type:complete
MRTANRKQWSTSLLEYHVAICSRYQPDVVDVEEQIAPIMVRHGTVRATPYRFDLRLPHRNGQRTAISVKPQRKAERHVFRAKMVAVARVATMQAANRVCVATERNVDPIELANAKLFHAARHPDPYMDKKVTATLDALTEPMSIRDFLSACGVGSTGYWSVIRLIRSGAVKVAAVERITPRTVIARGENI